MNNTFDRGLLNWIDSQQKTMQDLLIQWSSINTHSLNSAGLKILSQHIVEAFAVFNEHITFLPLPPYQPASLNGKALTHELAPAISIQKRPKAPKQILFVCHFDTVYSIKTSFDVIKNKNVLNGPGVADAKGGIVVMLKALEAFERSPVAKNIGWRIVLNTDEEIGSPGSFELWKRLAPKFDLCFIFEPSLPNGDLVSSRKGSANLALTAHGRSAHAGRNPEDGRNAIQALAECVYKIEGLSHEDCKINFGYWEGGGPVNVVTENALTQFNIRFSQISDYKNFIKEVTKITKQISQKREVKVILSGQVTAEAKPLIPETLKLLKMVKECGKELGFNVSWKETAGVCDGNRLQSLGLPTIDSLGVQGNNLHSSREFVRLDSLVQRTKLTTLLLLKLAQEEKKL